MPDNPSNQNNSVSPQDKEMADKLMQELKSQGVDVGAMQNGVSSTTPTEQKPAPTPAADPPPVETPKKEETPPPQEKSEAKPSLPAETNPNQNLKTEPVNNPAVTEKIAVAQPPANTAINSSPEQSLEGVIKEEKILEEQVEKEYNKQAYWLIKISKDKALIVIFIILILLAVIWSVFSRR